MLYGLYHSAQGAQAQTFRVDVLANNLANASTTAFKRDLAVFQSHQPYDVENGVNSEPPGNQNALSGGTTPAQIITDFRNGPLKQTGGSLDVALSGQGFFQVSDGTKNFLTRNGEFGLSATGDLISPGSGMKVLSSTGQPINIPPDAQRVVIGSDGGISVIQQDGSTQTIGKLALMQPASLNQLQKVGNSLYSANGEVGPAGNELSVRQGFTEVSGVNSVTEMINLIHASRAVEANVNMIKFQDESLDRLLQSAGTH